MPPTKAKLRLSSDDRKVMIIAAAKRVLAQAGLRAFTMSKVAKEANVAIGLISHYFGGIDGLVEEVLRASVAMRLPVQDSKPKTESEALTCIHASLLRHFDPAYYDRSNLMVWFPVIEHYTLKGQSPNNITRRDDEEVEEFRSSLEVLVAVRKLDLDPVTVSRTFFALLDGLWLRWCYGRHGENADWERSVAIRFLEHEVGPLNLVIGPGS